MAIQRFIIRSRVQAAAHELTHSQRTISEIALMFGFSDQSAFTNQFRAITGLPPRQYRERYLTQGDNRAGGIQNLTWFFKGLK